ncbi:HD domain-containing protein [Microbispora sp. H10885]|uniref:HD domain-containing protein n=1 Tax=Microbispora sp. H10885 TaxID=2729110 RepID=UPI0015FF39B0|nr:HD domain-containing protein [Microbispora sp. H10885]
MRLPTDAEIRALHERHAPSEEAFDLVHTHCEIVCAIALRLAGRAGLDVDAELVRAGSLLHDIGVYRLYDGDGRLDHAGYVRHGILGHELLRAEGLPESLCRFCSHHTGVGISREDVLRQGLPLPPRDYLAESAEEELVMFADKFHSKTVPPRFVTADAYAAHVRRYGEDKAEVFASMRAVFGVPDLGPLAVAYGHEIV